MTNNAGNAGAIPFGLQLFSIRHTCAADAGRNFPAVVAELARMGYRGVEFAGYYGWGAADLRRILDDNGLACCGAHVGIDLLLGDELDKSFEFHRALGNRFLIVPILPAQYRDSIDAWKRTAGVINGIAERLRPHGMFTGYHNHLVEFKPVGGEVPWEVFFSRTGADVVMQVDVGNALEGGGDPFAMLERFPGRARTIHLKEFGGAPDAVIGQGEVDWKKLLDLAGKTGGTEWFIVEHERQADRAMADVEMCLRYLKEVGRE
jgi:sugar phosphate isomerase/epimerase